KLEINLGFSQLSSSKISKGLDWYYLQYCLITGLYMLEPWERAVFNTFVVTCFAIFIYVV
uniref:Small subunit of serine palmitoyltransferase A n=1 Tax=Parascaris equorum TaxID=6256 RepID=A0A914R603_PAREQ